MLNSFDLLYPDFPFLILFWLDTWRFITTVWISDLSFHMILGHCWDIVWSVIYKRLAIILFWGATNSLNHYFLLGIIVILKEGSWKIVFINFFVLISLIGYWFYAIFSEILLLISVLRRLRIQPTYRTRILILFLNLISGSNSFSFISFIYVLIIFISVSVLLHSSSRTILSTLFSISFRIFWVLNLSPQIKKLFLHIFNLCSKIAILLSFNN